jgi:cytochrome b
MAEQPKIKVWDIGVRLFHWSLVVLFFVAYFTGDEEDMLHIYAGYGVLALVAFRLVWGVVGTKYARFADFIYGPATAWRYVRSVWARKPLHYLGHNPLGGWMVVALLLSLAAACWTGLEAYGEEGHGPLAQPGVGFISSALAHGDDDATQARKGGDAGEEFWEEAHEAAANFTLFLVILHIAGVAVASVTHKENFVRAMVTGYKTVPRERPPGGDA